MSDGIGNVKLRKATHSDATIIVRFLRLMVTDMEAVGGHAVARGDDHWAEIKDGVPDRLQSENRIYLLAEFDGEPIGFGEAKQESTIPTFAPKSIVHISSLYVTPEHRGEGIGKSILRALLDWGRERGCSEAELNVLTGNPARVLYKDLGFEDFEVKMRRKL